MANTVDEKGFVGFDEALKKSGFGKFNLVFITLAGGVMACAFIELTSVNFVLPVAQCDLDLTSSNKGILSAIGYIGVILSSHLWGFMSDTRGRKKTLIPTLLMAFAVTVASSLVNSFWVLVFLRFLNGFFISCASSTIFAYLGEFHDARNRARVLMSSSILYSLISILLPTFAVITINQEWSFELDWLGVTFKPWRLFLIICGLPNLICALVLYFFIPESPKFEWSQGNEEETLKILQRIHRMNTKDESFEVKGILTDEEFGDSGKKTEGFFKFMWTQSVPLFQGQHLRNFLTACFIQFASCNTSNGFWTFLPEIMNKVSLWIKSDRGSATVCEIFHSTDLLRNSTEDVSICMNKLEISTFIHAYEIVLSYAVCYALLALLINRVGKLAIILVVTLSTGLVAFLLIFVAVPEILSYMYIYMILTGLTISVINSSTVELFPTKMRAMAVCLSMMAGRFGSATGSIVIGYVIDKYCEMTFLMPTVLLLTSAVLACTIPNIAKRFK